MQAPYTNPRIDRPTQHGDPLCGQVKLDPAKTLWTLGMFAGGAVGALYWFSLSGVILFVLSTLFALCFGHSLGMHRRFIHRSFECPKWLEYSMVHCGVLVGMAGPLSMLKTHDLRDWAQRQNACHPYFSHDEIWYRDFYWQMFCRIELEAPPDFRIEADIRQDRVYRWMERTWRWQQLPWALLFFALGGMSWLLWGICARVSVSLIGHWLVGYFAHNAGHKDWHVEGAAVQGHNVPWCALLTMGECWHNNHHAFPGSARLGLAPGQWDPGWDVLNWMQQLGLIKNPVLPAMLPHRVELRSLKPAHRACAPVTHRLAHPQHREGA